MEKFISNSATELRAYWIEEIQKSTGNFGDDASQLEKKIADEIKNRGAQTLIDHLRLCGNIPESYKHDSSQEKMYSKYTDVLLAESFKQMGMKSLVLKERSDAADVEVFAKKFSFVADAKSFRLSRTAKNQKDFKIQAMDSWKRGKPFAMVVCPIYQLPGKSSQIYAQAIARNVCIFTYSHLSLLTAFSLQNSLEDVEKVLHAVFNSIVSLNPSKNASEYWLAINHSILGNSDLLKKLWESEKRAVLEAITYAKEESLYALAQERERIMRMSHEEALREILKIRKIESRVKIIKSINDSEILEIL